MTGCGRRVGDIVDRNLRDVDEVRPALTACIREIVRTITRAPGRNTLVRLLISEAPHFPVILHLSAQPGDRAA